MRTFYIIILLVSWSLISCSDGAIVDRFEDIPNSEWFHENRIEVPFTIEDTNSYYELYCNLRIESEYAFRNLYLMMTIQDPDGKITAELLDIPITEKSGKWLGSGMGSVLSYQHLIGKKRAFKKAGDYTVILQQNSRQDLMPNIRSAGIKIIKKEEIF